MNGFVRLLGEAFPSWERFGAGCTIFDGMTGARWDTAPQVLSVVDAVERAGQRDAFIRRLQLGHPSLGREHLRAYDDAMWSAFSEGEALAWALDVADLGTPEFIEDEGSPDLYVPSGRLWIEVKTVQESDAGVR